MRSELNIVEVLYGDITKLEVDAIVNAANSSLKGGGGVDGAIHRAGGELILRECLEYVKLNGRLSVGNAMITRGGNLKAKYVIHTVGPVWMGGDNGESELLSNAYKNSLKLAVTHNIKTIAFPNISTGIYGYPKSEAAKVAIDTIRNFILDLSKSQNETIKKIIFCCWDKENYEIYLSYLNEQK